MSAPLARRVVPIVDTANPPTPLPAGAREWFGLSLGHFLEQGEIWGAWAGPEQAMLVLGPGKTMLGLGPPRSGKTSSVVIPRVIGAPAAVVSTSTKPDVLLATCGI